MMKPIASQLVLLSAFKTKHILGFNTMHHDDFWDGSASPQNMDRWAVSQGSVMPLQTYLQSWFHEEAGFQPDWER